MYVDWSPFTFDVHADASISPNNSARDRLFPHRFCWNHLFRRGHDPSGTSNVSFAAQNPNNSIGANPRCPFVVSIGASVTSLPPKADDCYRLPVVSKGIKGLQQPQSFFPHGSVTAHKWPPSSASFAFSFSVSSCPPLAPRPHAKSPRSDVNGGSSPTVRKLTGSARSMYLIHDFIAV